MTRTYRIIRWLVLVLFVGANMAPADGGNHYSSHILACDMTTVSGGADSGHHHDNGDTHSQHAAVHCLGNHFYCSSSAIDLAERSTYVPKARFRCDALISVIEPVELHPPRG